MMPTDPQLLLLLAVAMHGGGPAPTMPVLIHGDYVAAAPVERLNPAKHLALTIDARGIRSASLSCAARSLEGASGRSHGIFDCSSKGSALGASSPRPYKASIQLRLAPGGRLEVFGLEEDGEAVTYVLAPPAPR